MHGHDDMDVFGFTWKLFIFLNDKIRYMVKWSFLFLYFIIGKIVNLFIWETLFLCL